MIFLSCYMFLSSVVTPGPGQAEMPEKSAAVTFAVHLDQHRGKLGEKGSMMSQPG